ncbi:uncharacterized protein LOC123320159 [Coccinella septempunctata]|uniref:uncharacterized protein LOC123320159 n=1 Tax=Coccinella septempunctata TaxID=41139 RepID=UPI001D067308|nr:uncharacterized protein LOC123320159 [Coccinella septempunctata]
MATAQIVELNESNICKLCQNALGKYVCPKCNVLYCSLSCYRSEAHQSCSEQFYKDSVFEELKLNEINPADQLKMASILKSTRNDTEISDIPLYQDDGENSPVESYDSDDDKDTRSLQERLAGIDLDDPEQVWANLDEDERKEFIALTQDYKAKNIVQCWKAWWTYSYNTKVQEVGSKSNSYQSKCPKVGDISKFKDICKQNTHVSVKFNLYNILAGYAFVTRYFNGEHLLFPKETISFIATIALSLKSHQNFLDFASAIKSVENKIMENDWINCEVDSLSDMSDDLEKIISGPVEMDPNYYIVAALCDIHNLLKKSICKKKENEEGAMSSALIEEHFPVGKINTLKEMKLYIKRIEYFMSYVQNFYSK